MTDNGSSSEFDEDDESAGDEIQTHSTQQHSSHHQSNTNAFAQRFSNLTKQFPSSFKKAVSRERITTNTNDDHQDYHHHEKASSFGSLFKNQRSFLNRIRSSSDNGHNNNNNNNNNNGAASPSPGHHSLHSHHSSSTHHSHSSPKPSHTKSHKSRSSKHNRKKQRSVTISELQQYQHQTHQHQHQHQSHHIRSSPTPPSIHSAATNSSHHSIHDIHDMTTKRDHAFEVILNENRALKSEIEVYKQGINTLNVEKEDLEQNYEELKSKVTDVTTQLR
eukprot:CAMPEP_0201597174 /NCGR_PEP_ID=MMETSP0190_2-20130828/193731_1 /ASSEMBLY_ACC=CAM_ASM_000263 /TAXON_ID=37353 /ORGANISM="Rosalina sp." /LENGTH=275 /DNA_ID=CAMNT_0048058005 /DNA_START=74 /DNA_END=898 /DNA_ORIENTATION=-